MSRRWGIGMPVSSLANVSTGDVLVVMSILRQCKRPSFPRSVRRYGGQRWGFEKAGCSKSAHVVEPKRDSGCPRTPVVRGSSSYFSSTTAPCASSFFLISSASCLVTPSFTVPGAPSTRSFASFRPRLVIARISLITWIFFSPPALSTTVNSVFSSAAGAAAAPPAAPPAAGAAAGAAIVTPNLLLKASISSASSNTDMLPMASRMSSLLIVCVAMVFSLTLLRCGARGSPLFFQRLQGANHRVEQSVQHSEEPRHRRLQGAAQLREQLLFGGQRRQALHLGGRDRLPLHQADLYRGFLEFFREIGEHLCGTHRIRACQHQCGWTGEMLLQSALLALRLRQRPLRERVLHHHVLDADRAEAAAEVRDVRHVETREIGDVDRLRLGDLPRQRRDHLLFLRLGPVHTWYPAGSTRTPGPIVLETVTERI